MIGSRKSMTSSTSNTLGFARAGSAGEADDGGSRVKSSSHFKIFPIQKVCDNVFIYLFHIF